MYSPPRITLIPKRVAWCLRLARARDRNAQERGRRPGNFAPNTPEKAFALHVRGAYGEAAGMLCLLPRKWNLFQYTGLHDLPDYDDWVDMKTAERRYRTTHLIVQQDDPIEWAYCLCFPDPHPIYELAGWCYGYEAREHGTKGDLSGKGRDWTYNVPHNHKIIKPMEELRRLMHARYKCAIKVA